MLGLSGLFSHLTSCRDRSVRGVRDRGGQIAFLKVKSNLKPNHEVNIYSNQASNQITVPKNCQIKPQIKSGSSSFQQIKSQIKPPDFNFYKIKSQIKPSA